MININAFFRWVRIQILYISILPPDQGGAFVKISSKMNIFCMFIANIFTLLEIFANAPPWSGGKMLMYKI